MSSVQLTTRRLLLREFAGDDWEDVHAFRADALVARATEFKPESVEETREWLRFVARCDERQPRLTYNLAVALKTNGRVIGWIGIGLPSRRTSSLREYDYGYCLNRAFWNRGYMSEAAQAVLAFGFGCLRGQRIFAECHVTNPASARVMAKAGMRLEGTVERRAPDGLWRAYFRYVLHDWEWQALVTGDDAYRTGLPEEYPWISNPGT